VHLKESVNSASIQQLLHMTTEKVDKLVLNQDYNVKVDFDPLAYHDKEIGVVSITVSEKNKNYVMQYTSYLGCLIATCDENGPQIKQCLDSFIHYSPKEGSMGSASRMW
jgi:hypothetical protein